MADLENDAPNLDNLDAKGISDLKERMTNGEDVSKPVKPVSEAAPVADAIDDGDDNASETEPTGDQPGKVKQDTVPFKRFDSERNKRKEAETKYEKLQADNARMMEQFNAMMARQEPKPVVETPLAPPDANVDPLGAIQHITKEFETFKNETVQERTQRVQREEYTQQVNSALNFAREEFGTAAKSDPTIQKAYESLLVSFANEQKAYGVPDTEIAGKLAEIEQQHIFYALQRKIPLGEYVKSIAAARGWNPNAAPPVENQAEADAGNQKVVDTIRKASASLSDTGGAVARTGMPSPQALADMTKAQYSKYRETHTVGEAFGIRN